jgi:2,4-diaminopentanoate dehydrogenase
MPHIRVVHLGLGPIGAGVACQIAAHPGFKIVGAVDIDPAKAGQDLGAVVGLRKKLGVRVQADLARVLKGTRPHIVVHCTSSSLKRVEPELEALIKARVSVVSTTEELAYPMRTHRKIAASLDAKAKKAKIGLLATGVNPGFTMDALPIMMTAACARVDRVAVQRIQDARTRRLPFQQKIGAGLTLEQFEQKVEDGSVRHVGFTQSIAMIGDALGWKLDRITDQVHPKIAERTVASDLLAVDPGYVCGIIQDGVGYRRGKAVITLHLEAYLGAPESYDQVDIEGTPRLSTRCTTGYHGDIVTAAMVVNAIPKVLAAAPGLHTMRSLALPSFFSGR